MRLTLLGALCTVRCVLAIPYRRNRPDDHKIGDNDNMATVKAALR